MNLNKLNNNLIIKKKYISFDFNPINLQLITNIESWNYNLDNQFVIYEEKNKYYLVYKNKDKKSLNIIDINSTIILKELKNIHKLEIYCIRHYIKNNNNIIITSSMDNCIKIFDFTNNYKLILEIKGICNSKKFYYNKIFSVLLLSDNNNDYVISCNRNENYLKLFDFKNGNLLKNNFCEDYVNGVDYIESYYDEKLNKNFIIKSNKVNPCISSYYFETGKIYHEYNNLSACNVIIKNIKEIVSLLFINTYSQILFIYDFHKGILKNQIKLKNELNCLLIWNEKYIISGGEDYIIHIIDIEKNEEIKQFKNHNNFVYNLDKVKINNDEYLISQGYWEDGIKIWKIIK